MKQSSIINIFFKSTNSDNYYNNLISKTIQEVVKKIKKRILDSLFGLRNLF